MATLQGFYFHNATFPGVLNTEVASFSGVYSNATEYRGGLISRVYFATFPGVLNTEVASFQGFTLQLFRVS